MSAPECAVCARPVGDGLRLCVTCGVSLVDALREIPDLLAELDTARSGQTKFAGERVGGASAEVALPIADVTREAERGVRLLGERERSALINVLITWARTIAETNGSEFPSRTTGGLVEWLINRPHELRGHVAAEDLHSDILGAVIGLRRIVDRPADRRFVGLCPVIRDGRACGANLWAEVGASWVRCRTCREQHSVSELEDQAVESARHMLCTMPEVLRACEAMRRPIGKTTGYRWAREGKLVRRKWLHRTEHGEQISDLWADGATPVYLLGDALELARRETNEGGSTA
ncbi:hypothetical protein [Nocardia sp. NPDC058633]|uniref:hypothetical protein n=1 Tax=Nocardia sp. NPDC058633 TaxID=3346568 RepID=UPI00366171CE